MTWSLELSGGDLNLSSATFGTVTGEAKLVQDLRCYVLERMGTDDMHPEYGSLLDGGVRPDGTYQDGVIGTPNTQLASMMVESEIRRIVAAYQAMQLARARSDKAIYGKATLNRREVLLALTSLDINPVADTITATLHITTAANSSTFFDIALS